MKKIFIIILISFTSLFAQTAADKAQYAYQNGNQKEALKYLEQDLALKKESGNKEGMTIDLRNIGRVYEILAQNDKALDFYKQALAIAEELGNKEHIVQCLNDVGGLYQNWGKFGKALDFYKQALAIAEKTDNKNSVIICLDGIGTAYNDSEQYDKALDSFKKALIIAEKSGTKSQIGMILNGIGSVYRRTKEYEKAIEYLKRALAIASNTSDKVSIANCSLVLGNVYQNLEQYDVAINYYKNALINSENFGAKIGVAVSLSNIGGAYFKLKNYNESIRNLRKSIELLEKLRLAAPGDIKRDYFSRMVQVYQLLIASYLRNSDFINAMNTLELSSAKYLVEQLNEKNDIREIEFINIEDYQDKIKDNSAILSFLDFESDPKYFGIATIIVDNKNITASEADKKIFIKNVTGKYSNKITKINEKLRGLKVKYLKKEEDAMGTEEIDQFKKIINYYRYLLSQPGLGIEEENALKYIGSELYNFLFNNIEKYLPGKENLIIMPIGLFAFIPFETLIMPDGRYLVEKYNIKYTQSLSVMEIIEKRKYSNSRKPMIAFGGGIYDKIAYQKDMLESERQLQYLEKEALIAVNRGQSTRDYYFKLGFGKWRNLPGTLTEVNGIKTIVNDMDLYTGKDVDESTIKSLSEKGYLKDYKVIHFATHGIVVPEMPELSALVLSQYKEEKNGEDGYLRMQEIAALNINADFVNLSACETGLGKIYGGEGVVGLTQSFLLSGANGLSVSLWQVADKSTMEFMIGMYKKVNENGLSYDKAITEMKREYIKSGKYSLPFYWAPFVYYGK